MINSTDFTLDFNVSSLDTVSLTEEQIQQAAELGMSIPEPEKQWQTYLNTLALLGFKTWLSERDITLILTQENAHNILNAICQLTMGEFKLCLLIQGILEDEIISIHQAILERDKAHFYILITVDEEQAQVSMEGLICYDQLRQYQKAENLILQSDQTYEIPVNWFDPDMNHLLLYFRCLDPFAISLEEQSSEPQLSLSPINSNTLLQPVINVRLWIQNQLDELAENLSWLLLPSPELVTVSFRSLPTFYHLIEQLQDQGLIIPYSRGQAILEVMLGEIALQLYAVTWLLEESDEWSLLLILGAANDEPLPEGLKLQIQDQNSILSEQVVNPYESQSYLYTQVIGELNEQFILTLSLSDVENLTLPPFTFSSEE